MRFYFNSFFNLKFTILPIIFLKIFAFKYNIILAPRGELFKSEIKKKFLKKKSLNFFSNFF